MRPNTITAMNEYMLALSQLFDAGDNFGKALIKFGKAYAKYVHKIWVESYDNLQETLQGAKRHVSGPVYEDHGSYCSITSTCYACDSPVSEKGGCTNVHCSHEHDEE